MQLFTRVTGLGWLALGLFLFLRPALAQEPPVAPLPVQDAATDKQQRLNELLKQYQNNEVSSGEYQRRRAEILGRPTQTTDPWDRASVRSSRPTNVLQATASPLRAGSAAPALTSAPLAPLASTASQPTAATPNPLAELESAIVPGADLIIRADLSSIRKSPIQAVMKKLSEKNAAARDKTESFPGAEWMKQVNTFQHTLGLADDDIDGVVISVDMDKVPLAAGGLDAAAIKNLRGAAAFRLGKEVTTAQIKQAILAATKTNGKALELTEVKMGSAEVLALTPKSEDEPPLHLTVLGGRTVLAGLNRTSLSEALGRVGRDPAPMQSGLSAGLIPGSQVQVAFVVPQSLRDTLKGLGESAKAGAGNGGQAGAGPGAMLAGFQDVKNINLGLAFDKNLTVQLLADMGQNQAAAGVNMMVQMLKPQLIASLAQQSGQSPQAFSANLLNSQVSGSKLRLSVTLGQALLESIAAR